MECLYAEGCILHGLDVAAKQGVGGQQQGGAYAFATKAQSVVYGVIELVWFGDELFVGEDVLNFL